MSAYTPPVCTHYEATTSMVEGAHALRTTRDRNTLFPPTASINLSTLAVVLPLPPSPPRVVIAFSTITSCVISGKPSKLRT